MCTLWHSLIMQAMDGAATVERGNGALLSHGCMDAAGTGQVGIGGGRSDRFSYCACMPCDTPVLLLLCCTRRYAIYRVFGAGTSNASIAALHDPAAHWQQQRLRVLMEIPTELLRLSI